MINYRPFDRTHLNLINPHDIYSTDKGLLRRWADAAPSIEGSGAATSIFFENVILAIILFMPIYDGVAEVITISDRRIEEHKKEYVKALKKGIQIHMDARGLWRLQATIRADVDFAERWIEVLGFEKEGLLRKFGPSGEDHFMFARVL